MAGVPDDQGSAESGTVAHESRPTIRCLDRHIIPLVAAKWYDLSLELLDVEQERSLQIIDEQGDTLSCCREMFRMWLEMSNTATWNQLMEAARRHNLNDAVRTIEQLCLPTGGC